MLDRARDFSTPAVDIPTRDAIARMVRPADRIARMRVSRRASAFGPRCARMTSTVESPCVLACRRASMRAVVWSEHHAPRSHVEHPQTADPLSVGFSTQTLTLIPLSSYPQALVRYLRFVRLFLLLFLVLLCSHRGYVRRTPQWYVRRTPTGTLGVPL